jgi:hypothetical protein
MRSRNINAGEHDTADIVRSSRRPHLQDVITNHSWRPTAAIAPMSRSPSARPVGRATRMGILASTRTTVTEWQEKPALP